MSSKRRVLVTGGGRGIGRSIVTTLARDGLDVCIFDRERPDDEAKLVEQVESFGQECFLIAGDVRDGESVGNAIETIAGRWGGLDVLVNNAGVVRDRVCWKMSDDEWGDVVGVNLTGTFQMCRAAIPLMRQSGSGSIVNISSINGLRGKLGQVNYAASKAGVIGLTKSLAREVARFDITVNAVAPGYIETEILASMPEEAKKQSLGETLLGRAGDVSDVAEAVAFLCSDRARFITGEVLKVDGGQYV